MLAAIAAIAISTSFEGGSAGRVEQLAPDHLRIAVKGQADQNHRNRQANWYYFKLEHLPRKPIQIDLVDLVGEYNFVPGSHAVTKNTRPVYSYDEHTWTRFEDSQTTWDDKEVKLTLRFTPEHETMWIAHGVPYTNRDLEKLVASHSPWLTHETIGKSVHGREIPLLTITDPAAPESGKRVVWLMARQHAWETGTSWTADGAARFLMSDNAEAARIRRTTIFKVLPIFDVDGVAEGAVRFNANGYDNNRNWDTVDPKVMPEIASVRRGIFAWLDAGHRIDVFFAMHNDESSDYVEGPLKDGGPHVDAVARELVDCLRATTSFYDPLSPRDSFRVKPDKGRMTVAQDLFAERKIPAFLNETMVERHPQLGHSRSAQDFMDYGAGLAKCLARVAHL